MRRTSISARGLPSSYSTVVVALVAAVALVLVAPALAAPELVAAVALVAKAQ